MKKQIFASILVVLCLASISVGPVNAQDSDYTVLDLGTLGGPTSSAVAINNNGQVVGYSATALGNTHAFLWENGTMLDLGTLGGTYSAAFTLNDLGQVIGTSTTASGEYHAFFWEKGVMLDLGTLGGSDSSAYDINKQGQVIGTSSTALGEYHAFLWQGNAMTDLGTLGGIFCTALDINETGQIAGYGYNPSGYTHALLWDNGTMTDLGTLGNAYTNNIAYAINENAQIIGVSSNDFIFSEHAFLYENGQMISLGTLGGLASFVTDINNLGQVVGNSMLPNEIQHGYLWENGTMIDLYPSGRNFGTSDINDHGQIVGSLSIPPNVSHAYLWKNGEMKDLGVPQGWQSSGATAINENGLIIGSISLMSEMDYIYHAAIWIPQAEKLSIDIDIKPASNTNPINLGAKGVIPVAVLTTAGFKASDLDPATVLFAGASPLRWSKQDVDYDGDMDLLFHFDVKKLTLTNSSVEASLTGKTFDGTQVEGKDKVTVVPAISYP